MYGYSRPLIFPERCSFSSYHELVFAIHVISRLGQVRQLQSLCSLLQYILTILTTCRWRSLFTALLLLSETRQYYRDDLAYMSCQPQHHYDIAASILASNAHAYTAQQAWEHEWNTLGLPSRLTPQVGHNAELQSKALFFVAVCRWCLLMCMLIWGTKSLVGLITYMYSTVKMQVHHCCQDINVTLIQFNLSYGRLYKVSRQ